MEHRGALVIRADEGPLSANVSNTDPAYAKEGSLGVALETFEPGSRRPNRSRTPRPPHRSADLTNAFVEGAAQILDASEVNAGAGPAAGCPAT